MHTENNVSLFLLRKMPDFWTQMLLNKNCESLSPETKAQILKNNAVAHTKNNKSLSLPKKKLEF